MSERDTGATVPEGRPKTMARFKRRLSRILGKDDVRRANEPGTSTAAAVTTDKRTSASEPAKTPTATTSEPGVTLKPTTSKTTKPATAPVRPKSILTAAEHAKFQEEKVRALFAKYNVTLEVGEWTPAFKTDVPRVEKKIRMRVHRTCHRCQTQFAVEKVCNNCNHKFCKKCPRYPHKKTEQPKSKEGVTAVGGETQYIKKPITQRTRMICHKCQTPFKSKTKECGNCQHERCAECKRSLSRPDTAAGGGAVPLPRSFIKWTCHECENVHRDPENPCLKCGHNKCDQCARERVHRPATQLTAGDEMKEAEERMKGLGVSSQATAA